MAQICSHRLFYQPSDCHGGMLAREAGLICVRSEDAVIASVQPAEYGRIPVRGCDLYAKKRLAAKRRQAVFSDGYCSIIYSRNFSALSGWGALLTTVNHAGI